MKNFTFFKYEFKFFKGNGMGYICERHHPCENKRSGTSFTGYRGGDYIIQAPGYFSANDAKGQSLIIFFAVNFDTFRKKFYNSIRLNILFLIK